MTRDACHHDMGYSKRLMMVLLSVVSVPDAKLKELAVKIQKDIDECQEVLVRRVKQSRSTAREAWLKVARLLPEEQVRLRTMVEENIGCGLETLTGVL